jgi:hypothetical protein
VTRGVPASQERGATETPHRIRHAHVGDLVAELTHEFIVAKPPFAAFEENFEQVDDYEGRRGHLLRP